MNSRRDLTKVAITLVVFGLAAGLASLQQPASVASAGLYSLTFSTYLGGAGQDVGRGIDTDASGNIYLTGATVSPTFPTTEGPAFQLNSAQCGSLGSFGKKDVFLAKLTPTGQIIWSRLIDTPCYAEALAVHVDAAGYVYVAGSAGDHFPTTAGTIQPAFNGSKTNPSPLYGAQSGFVAKLSPDGSRILWATYFGGSDQSFIRDMALDSAGSLYLAVTDVTAPNPFISPGAFQTTLHGGQDMVAAKISNDGSTVRWASYFGGSGNDGGGPSVRLDSSSQPVFMASTTSTDLPTTPGAFQRRLGGGLDVYVVKFSADGSHLVFSTYFGGSGEESTETHHLALDRQGNLFISFYVNSTDMPVTTQAYQKKLGGGYDFGLAKFSPTGSLLAATYLGGTGDESPQGLATDLQGNLVLFGSSASAGFGNCAANTDAVVARMSSDLHSLLSAYCIGGNQIDQARDGTLDLNGNSVAIGWSDSSNFPLMNPVQKILRGGYDVIVFKLTQGAPSLTNRVYLPLIWR